MIFVRKISGTELHKYFDLKTLQHYILFITFWVGFTKYYEYILDNFGKHEQRIKFAALINNKPSKVKVDYHGYEINKDEVPSWIVFPWEEWDK